MRSRHSCFFVLLVVVLLAGASLFAVACEGSDETSTTGAGDGTTTTASDGTATGDGEETTVSTVAGTSGSIVVTGLVDNPTTLNVADLEEMTVVEIEVEDEGTQTYRGVRFSDLFDTFGLQSDAARLSMVASDGYKVELSLIDIQWSPDAMVAIGEDGKLNVVIPDLEKKTWVKDIVALEFK